MLQDRPVAVPLLAFVATLMILQYSLSLARQGLKLQLFGVILDSGHLSF